MPVSGSVARDPDRPLTPQLPFARGDHGGERAGLVYPGPLQGHAQRVPSRWKAGAHRTRSSFASSVWKHPAQKLHAQLTPSGCSPPHPSCGPLHPRGEQSVLFDMEEVRLWKTIP